MLIVGLCLLGIIYGCAGERKYEIKIENFESKAFVGGLVQNASVELTAYNATVTCISGFLELIGMIPTEALINVVGYERSREDKNAYQEKPTVNYTVNICDFLENDDNIMPELLLYSNLDQSCPVIPKNYSINCFNLEAGGLPDEIPGEEHWQFTVFLYAKNSTLSEVLAYAMTSIFFDTSEYKKKQAAKRGQ